MLRLVVLISGAGTNLRALIAAQSQPDSGFEIVAVGADRAAAGLDYADDAGIPTFRVDYRNHPDRGSWGRALAAAADDFRPDLIVLSGLMRILPAELVDHWAHRIVNTHPALLPSFPGAHAVRDALAAGVDETGATVHLVDSGVDTGPVLAQQSVAIVAGDDETTLHDRIKVAERQLLAQTLTRIAHGDIDCDAVAVATQPPTSQLRTHD
ncbi:phosphoribosylglycinamide formyltransferase [Pseudoclavibacter sp. CFCC 14310]|uniref:phosphoribosylglycinamide formyltransferase n=1 Tax=Pseudoclavibacter sp. CFCC 14310 TaxID=2615180 RepID=UPI001300FC93|nr:phosphoribosylglycinamide formyltransferase [Pseudoclavibacter sp. CFCC 14310]KAB1647518.1 phosphoribosylglycinamide formyltransferase [Pseudoclavibacter sp. CFCC 14310]